jgi:peptidoglycan/xylan/chitin deacetylase (PgdA/CDA1 family)
MRYFLVPFLVFFGMVSLAMAEDTPGASPSPSPTPASSPEASTGASKPATWFSVNVDGPYIAMTFDDGPSPETTPRLLDILKQRNIKATFFMIGQNAERNPAIVKRILAEGHEIGNHSWTHPQLSKLSDDRVTEEINKTQNAIKDSSGYTPVLMRPPYGAITARQKDWIEKQFGLSVIIWSVDPFDWKRPGASVIEERILAGARPGAIVLSHDIHKQTVDAMPATLDALAAKGFKFVTVSQLIAMNKPKSSATPSPQSRPSGSPRPSPAKKRARLAAGN